MGRKLSLFMMTLVFSIVFLGCNSQAEDDFPDLDEDNQNETEREAVKDEESLVIHTHQTEEKVREVEGMEQEVQVVNYEIQPYEILFQLDDDFSSIDVNGTEITITREDVEDYKINLNVFEETTLDRAIDELQKQYNEDDFEYVGDLEDDTNDQDLVGKKQVFASPMITGFYVYEIGDSVITIQYEYPEEAGDGMGPLIDDLSNSIKDLQEI